MKLSSKPKLFAAIFIFNFSFAYSFSISKTNVYLINNTDWEFERNKVKKISPFDIKTISSKTIKIAPHTKKKLFSCARDLVSIQITNTTVFHKGSSQAIVIGTKVETDPHPKGLFKPSKISFILGRFIKDTPWGPKYTPWGCQHAVLKKTNKKHKWKIEKMKNVRWMIKYGTVLINFAFVRKKLGLYKDLYITFDPMK